ncbi:MAG: class I SAM-dependent methyltransferase [Deltaproteobacteria bacterium]|nr:class I SAM-dependent methyltransferase [Deltaproteobacteria bacterium]
MSDKDTSRISITAHTTGYTWFANGLAPRQLATRWGRVTYRAQWPVMAAANRVLGISDLETALLQRHVLLDHLVRREVETDAGQVLELACGLSPRGWRFFRSGAPKGVRYVEADLPGMAEKKRRLLEQAGPMAPGHTVTACDVLAKDGPLSLEKVAAAHLDPAVPTLVVTEGLVNYFPDEVLFPLLSRIAAMLSKNAGGVWLSDNIMNTPGPFRFLLRGFLSLTGAVARGRMYFHFNGEEDAAASLASLGFSSAQIHRPEDHASLPHLPQTRRPSFISILEARVRPEKCAGR